MAFVCNFCPTILLIDHLFLAIIVSPLHIDAVICRACSASTSMQTHSQTKKKQDAKGNWFRKNLPETMSKLIFMFATRSWQEFLRYRSVSKMWLHVPILEFMRPRLDKLTDHGCVNLSNIGTSLQYLHLKGCYLTDTSSICFCFFSVTLRCGLFCCSNEIVN